MDFRICVIHVSIFILICFTDKYKILVILYRTVQNLFTVLQTPIAEGIHVIPRRCDSNHQLISIGFHSLLDDIVLLRRRVGVYFIRNGNIAV